MQNALRDVRFISIFSFNFTIHCNDKYFLYSVAYAHECVVEIHKKALQRAINHRRGVREREGEI